MTNPVNGTVPQSRPLNPIALPLSGTRLIEASAGTGKTFTLSILYLRLVLAHGTGQSERLAGGLMPPQILVVTFTEAATEELRDRIRSRLSQCAALFSVQPGEKEPADIAALGGELALLRQIRDSEYTSAKSRAQARQRLLMAAEWMDESAISTIHGWCKRMLSEHAFDSGQLFGQQLEAQVHELEQEAAQDYWRRFVYALPSRFSAWWHETWQSPEKLWQQVKPLLLYRDNLGEGSAPAEALAGLEKQIQEIKKAWQTHREHLEATVVDAIKTKALNGHKLGLKSWEKWSGLLDEWAASSETGKPDLKTKAPYNRLTPAGIADALKDPAHPVAQHPVWAILEPLLADTLQHKWVKLAVLFHAVREIGAALESAKLRSNLMTFDDLLSKLLQALKSPRGEHLARTIESQFPVMLIDEFQDTDPRQYEIFRRIHAAGGEDRGLIMIGDPKQAIYAFRGGDIYTYLKAREDAADSVYGLTRNFRSSKTMVKATNHLFLSAEHARPGGAFSVNGHELPFYEVDAQGLPQTWVVDGEPAPALVFENWQEDPEQPLTKGDALPVAAGWCAERIVTLLNQGQSGRCGFQSEDAFRPLEPGDIAVLVRRGEEAKAVRKALRERGVRSVYLSDRQSVLETPEAALLQGWLSAFANPRSVSLIRAAMASLGELADLDLLESLNTDEQVLDAHLERFQGYHELWASRGVLPAVRQFLFDHEAPHDWVGLAEGERTLTNLLHLTELLQEESRSLDGIEALLAHYQRLLQDASQEADERKTRLESDAGLVQVVTIHKSKGLEYPLVFLPFAALTVHKTKGRRDWVPVSGPDGARADFSRSAEVEARYSEDQQAEDIRLLYVALTRARFSTWVGLVSLTGGQPGALGELTGVGVSEDWTGPMQELAQSLGDPLALCSRQIALQDMPMNCFREGDLPVPGAALVPVVRREEPWTVTSYTGLVREGLSSVRPTASAPDDLASDLWQEDVLLAAPGEVFVGSAREPGHVSESPAGAGAVISADFPKGAETGVLLHSILEYCADQGFDQVLTHPEGLSAEIERLCRARGWEVWVEPLLHWVRQILRSPVILGEGDSVPLLLSELDDYEAEMEFWFPVRTFSPQRLDHCIRQHLALAELADAPPLSQRELAGLLKGFIDLVFQYEGRYYVLDYKSNDLPDGNYSKEALASALVGHRYDVQAVIYVYALHRYLSARLPDYVYEHHVGGAVYQFIRGIHASSAGLCALRPDQALMRALDEMFLGSRTEAPG